MSNSVPASELVREGEQALRAADWAAARRAFERALAAHDSPAAHDGLGLALWWLNDIEDAHHHRSIAYREYRQAGAPGRAARLACWLGREQVFLNSNVPAMSGWFSRAEQLVEQLEPGVDRAWCALLRASMLASPAEMAAVAADVVATARQFGEGNLEAFGLAFSGQSLVSLGRVSDGMALLDEAMTMATSGEAGDLNTISEVFCVMLATCETAGDLTRSELWCRTALEFARRYSCPFLLAYCRTSYGGLMTALGRWREAEAALTEAIEAFGRGHRGLRVHAQIKLADLRACQGRLEEAELMLSGMEDQAAAAVPLARLHLQKGEPKAARAVLEQSLPAEPPYTLHDLPSLFALADALLELGDFPRLQAMLDVLTGLAAGARSPLLTAQVEYARGRVSFRRSDFTAARSSFEAALGQLRSYQQSLLAGQLRLRMAEVLQPTDPPGAVAWARGALATFERIGAAHDAAQAAALLRLLGAPHRGATRAPNPLTAREAEITALVARGLTNREIADRLVISAKTVEHHVSRILDKLGLQSRVEIAAFAASGRLPLPPE